MVLCIHWYHEKNAELKIFSLFFIREKFIYLNFCSTSCTWDFVFMIIFPFQRYREYNFRLNDEKCGFLFKIDLLEDQSEMGEG